MKTGLLGGTLAVSPRSDLEEARDMQGGPRPIGVNAGSTGPTALSRTRAAY